MRWLMLAAVIAVAVFSALNWRAQLQTQQKLDALTAARAERPAAQVPAPSAAPALPLAPEPRTVPREDSGRAAPPYVIEAPDLLTVEIAVKDPKTGKSEPLSGQGITGQHNVRLDGSLSLGVCGSIDVVGLTLDQAAVAVRKQVGKFQPTVVPAGELAVAIDVSAFNSKFYYVITDFAGDGEQVTRLPLTGSETVLDAVAAIGASVEGAAKKSIRVARPGGPGAAPQILPVDWAAITRRNDTATNYALRVGDRVYLTAGE